MPAADYGRLRDRPRGTAGAGPLEVAPLLGTWRNTNPESRGVVVCELSREAEELRVRAWGAAPEGLRAWGQTAVEGVFAAGSAPSQVKGFVATFRFPQLTVHLHANTNKGLLIVACLSQFHDGSGRADTFAREFYGKVQSGPPAEARSPGVTEGLFCLRGTDRPGGELEGEPRLALEASWTGTWLNCEPEAGGFLQVELSSGPEGLTLQATGVGEEEPIAWEPVAARLFAPAVDARRGTNFMASCRAGGTELLLHGWVKLGVLVLAEFASFAGDARAPYFDREFFRHASLDGAGA